jgi:hypothetical protein
MAGMNWDRAAGADRVRLRPDVIPLVDYDPMKFLKHEKRSIRRGAEIAARVDARRRAAGVKD